MTQQQPDRAAQAQNQGHRNTDTPPARIPGSLAGNLVRDPELRYTNSGRPCASVRLAVTRRYYDNTEQRWADAPTEFHDVKVWGTLGEHAVNTLAQGDRAVVTGYWTHEEWDAPDGEHKHRDVLVAEDIGASLMWSDVRILRTKGERGGGQHARPRNGGGSTQAGQAQEAGR